MLLTEDEKMDNSTPPTSIDAYIALFPTEVQAILQKVRATIQQAAPGAVEAIKYQMPTFVFNKKNLVHFAAYKKHLGFYPTPSGIEQFQAALSAYASSKGAVQFPLDKPIPYDLIAAITAFRMEEEIKRASAKKN
jgi:uncharacterized protein YdhG (YjbR/CyaY superfamily)